MSIHQKFATICLVIACGSFLYAIYNFFFGSVGDIIASGAVGIAFMFLFFYQADQIPLGGRKKKQT